MFILACRDHSVNSGLRANMFVNSRQSYDFEPNNNHSGANHHGGPSKKQVRFRTTNYCRSLLLAIPLCLILFFIFLVTIILKANKVGDEEKPSLGYVTVNLNGEQKLRGRIHNEYNNVLVAEFVGIRYAEQPKVSREECHQS